VLPPLRARREKGAGVVEAQTLTVGPHGFEIQTNLKTKTRSNLSHSKSDLPAFKGLTRGTTFVIATFPDLDSNLN
jgi:hypothetical protein